MNKFVKIVCLVVSLSCLMMAFAGCGSSTTSKSYTYSVDNGDSIKVSLDTSDSYDISSDNPFEISCDGEVLSSGTFATADSFEQYVAAVETDENAVLLESGEKDGNEYIFWSYDDSEFDYAIKIANSNTLILLGNIVSEESAKVCFERLTISVAES